MIPQSQLKAILFADISGSSALYKTKGNTAAKATVDSLLNTYKKLVESKDGKVIKTIGDEIMTSFCHADNALQAAMEMQQRYNCLLEQYRLKLSVGIGYGEVLSDKGDLFGEAVNDAAYLTTLAKGGQILLSESVYQQLNSHSSCMVREFDRVKIKGAEVNSLIYRVYWQEGESSDNETQLMSNELLNDALKFCFLRVKYNQVELKISANQTPFIIGRDAEMCDLVVEGNQVSREHCQINFNRGKFVLVDHSTNGCYLSSIGSDEFYLRREQYPLIDTTYLSLGLPAEQARADVIELFY